MKFLNKLFFFVSIFGILTSSCNKNDNSEQKSEEKVETIEKDGHQKNNSSHKKEEPKKVVETTPKPTPKPKPIAKAFALKKGTKINATPISPISSEEVKTGDIVSMKLSHAIEIDNKVKIPSGTIAKAKIVHAQHQKKLTGKSKLEVKLTSVIVEGKTYSLSTNTYAVEGKSNTGKTATKAGGGAALGAGIGALAAKKGNKGKGAGIGAAVGAAVGVGASAFQKKTPAVIENSISFTTQETTQVIITVMP